MKLLIVMFNAEIFDNESIKWVDKWLIENMPPDVRFLCIQAHIKEDIKTFEVK